MPDTISRAIIDALIPEGSAWNVAPDGDLDHLYDGMAENVEYIVSQLSILSDIRDPSTTPILSDLEREYGISTNTNLTESQRRESLAALVFQGENNGSKDDLQSVLQAAGFDVQVHENSPAVDPDNFLNNIFLMVADGDNAYAGFYPTIPGVYTSIAGKTGGSLLVNGATYIQRPDYISVANGDYMYAGNGNAYAGKYEDLTQTLVIYPIPDDPNSWPFFFFVGGDATRNVSGELTDIEFVNIPTERREEFERLILKYKPIHTWAGLMVNYT